MLDILGAAWWLIVTLGILVTVHEFGHFWVARRFGVKVLRFSLGFGPALWKRRGQDGTEYVLAAIPLGGYVSMLDERDAERPLAPEERAQAFNAKGVGARMAIVAAGPSINLVLAVLAFWAMFVIGKPDFAPVVGRSEGIAAEAGITAGDRILAIDGERVATWTHILLTLTRAALDRRDLVLELQDPDGERRSATLALSRLGEFRDEERTLETVGIIPRHRVVEAEIARVQPGSPAESAGLAPGDRIVAVEGEPVADFDDFAERLQRASARAEVVRLSVESEGQRRSLAVRPDYDAKRDRFLIGVSPAVPAHDALLRLDPLAALPAAFEEAWRLTEATLGMLWRMVTGVASTKNIAGPITIAQVAQGSARQGLGQFLFILGLISLSLAILNLLPIPLLDGGHLLFLAIEGLKGSPPSERVIAVGQAVGLFIVAGLIVLALYNDIVRLLS
jgi:regulator of sigma E protease